MSPWEEIFQRPIEPLYVDLDTIFYIFSTEYIQIKFLIKYLVNMFLIWHALILFLIQFHYQPLNL